MALNTAPGGEGEYAGGKGLILEYRIRTDDGFLTAGYTRSKIKPWSLQGGAEGSANYVEVLRVDGTQETYSFVSGLTVHTDDVIRVVTASGGGYGDPASRSADAVARDVRDGYITAEAAANLYGKSS